MISYNSALSNQIKPFKHSNTNFKKFLKNVTEERNVKCDNKNYVERSILTCIHFTWLLKPIHNVMAPVLTSCYLQAGISLV